MATINISRGPIRGFMVAVGAYSKGGSFKICSSRVGAYSRGAFSRGADARIYSIAPVNS